MAKCFFCKRSVGQEYYCWGCHTHICDECDHENDWPPEGHTEPEQHPIRFKGKVKKMTKTQELERAKTGLKRLSESYNKLWSDNNTLRNQLWTDTKALQDKHAAELAKLKAEHAGSMAVLANNAFKETELMLAESQRDSAINAYKYLVDSITKK